MAFAACGQEVLLVHSGADVNCREYAVGAVTVMAFGPSDLPKGGELAVEGVPEGPKVLLVATTTSICLGKPVNPAFGLGDPVGVVAILAARSAAISSSEKLTVVAHLELVLYALVACAAEVWHIGLGTSRKGVLMGEDIVFAVAILTDRGKDIPPSTCPEMNAIRELASLLLMTSSTVDLLETPFLMREVRYVRMAEDAGDLPVDRGPKRGLINEKGNPLPIWPFLVKFLIRMAHETLFIRRPCPQGNGSRNENPDEDHHPEENPHSHRGRLPSAPNHYLQSLGKLISYFATQRAFASLVRENACRM